MSPSESNDTEVILDGNIRKKYLEILRTNGVLDEVDTITMKEPAALKGQNMGSSSVYVQVKFKDPEIKPKNLFVKKFVDNSPGHTAMLKSSNLMEKETEFLRDWIPLGKALCKKYPGCEKFLDCFPECLYGDEEMVVLENLVLDNTFVMLPKEDFQDLHTAKFVLTHLAKFHATSCVILEETGIENFSNEFKYTVMDVFDHPVKPMYQMFANLTNDTVTNTIQLLKNNPVRGAEYAIEKLNLYIGKADQLIEECCKNEKDHGGKFLCLNHGDCWNNNMLFKADPETGKVYDMMFVDLQLTRLGSQSYDVAYYLYCSVKEEIRREHLKEMLEHYFNEFKRALEEGFNKKCLFKFEEFLDDFKKRNGFPFAMSLGAVPTMYAMKYMNVKEMGDDPSDMSKLFNDAIDRWIKENPNEAKTIAEETVKNIIHHFDNTL